MDFSNFKQTELYTVRKYLQAWLDNDSHNRLSRSEQSALLQEIENINEELKERY